ncbi:hypothetical protein L873DRAFT_1804656 [Choiromyces venosus 120613-1]|uniref:Uncharacterized protein n=1 Tax=Choiromyces venosus 120613-1 TaxID=1336337 RepID=A0A3N4K4P5_9PEZI|nr:hypothetical protein L873DRAFT_1804656 [Choiromyces venosus 120613-1]
MAKDKHRKKTSDEPKVPVTNDERFISVHNDPRFALPRRKDAKLKVDKRFERMYKDESFSAKASVDRYGRKIGKDAGEEIKRYYHISEEEEDEDEEEGGARVYDPARGEGVISTSEESSDEEEEGVGEAEEEAARAELEIQKEVPMGEVSRRFAAVNLDWDNVQAVDLLKTFSSFVTGGGRIASVTVYPSEFGKERMEREEMEGPPTEIFKPKGKARVIGSDDEDSDIDEEVNEKTIIKEDKGEEFDSGKLRNYQLERLRYFYAVVECDSPETAKHIYEQCDGAEYEATANFFDLRFIPDETSFEDDKPRDRCIEVPANYKPNDFSTDALQHSKVRLTWDEDDQQRKLATKRAFSQRDIEDMDLKDYLASSDSESESEAREAAKDKYRALLSATGFGKKDKSEPAGDMEVTFTSGLSEKAKDRKVIEEDEEEETTIAKYARKEKERRQRRKEKMKAIREGNDEGDKPENKKADKEKEAEAEDITTDLGFDDPFFADAPASKSAEKKEKKRKDREAKAAEAAENASKRAELELLMADEDADADADADGKKLHHFDMKQIVKAEKNKGKKGKHRKADPEPEGIQDGFEIDVKDPRFAAVYEKHEFAIDPTNPRFVKTKAMGKLLEERRNRTQKRNGDDGEKGEGERKRQKVDKGGKDKDELKRLVQSLKSKAKK